MSSGRALAIFILAPLLSINAMAQQLDWKTGYLGFLDNREADDRSYYAQTMFGSRLRGEIGFSPDGKNRLAAGLDFLYEFGWNGPYRRPSVVLYYENSFRNLDISFGAFNRYKKTDMPLALLTDTLNYYRPNIEGFFIEYKKGAFRQNVWLDWTGRKTVANRESFLFGFSGYYAKGLFIYQHHFIMNHISLTEPMEVGTYVRDDLGGTVKAGINLSSLTKLDSLVVIAGIIGSADRQRDLYDFRFSGGWTCELEAQYKRLGLHELVCFSNGLTILSGDSPYSSDFYNRTDLYYQIINSFIDARLQISYHHIPMADEVSTMVVIRINTGGFFRKSGKV
jgi:hypothetical protein